MRIGIEQEIGAKWVGRLPDSWGVFKVKHLTSIRNSNVDKKSKEGETSVRLCNYVDVYYNDRITADLDFMKATASQAEIARFRLRRGDVIITKDSESPDDIAVPAYVTRDFDDVLCGYHLALLRPNPARVDGRFLAYCFNAQDVNLQFQVGANGITRYGLSLDALGNALIPVPPLTVQHAIAEFLDRKTAAIDEIIRKKERLIELLEEKRQAVITRAVTKGLDPTVPMKDSGVEWLGAVPAHWAVAPVYARYEVQLGRMLDSKRITGEHLAPYLRNVDVQWNRINVINLPQMDFPREHRDRYVLRRGDVLVCEGGEIGRAAIWEGQLPECYYQKALHRLRPYTDRDVPGFMYYILFAAAHKGVFLADGNPNTIDHLTAEKLRVHRFPFPPREEQVKITRYLDERVRLINSTIEKVQSQTRKLREYRQTLISNAVTGKINVREPVAV